MKKLLLCLLVPSFSFAGTVAITSSSGATGTVAITGATSSGGGAGNSGGSTTQVQYNSGGSFAGSANFTTDGSSVTVSTISVGEVFINNGSSMTNNGSSMPMYFNQPNKGEWNFSGTSNGTGQGHVLLDYYGITFTPNIAGVQDNQFLRFCDNDGAICNSIYANPGYTTPANAFYFWNSPSSSGWPLVVYSTSVAMNAAGGLGVTYGATVGSMTVTGNGAGQINMTEGSSTTVTSASGSDILWADSQTHTFEFNPNNTSTYTVVGSSIVPTTGDLAIWSKLGAVIDGGPIPSSGGGAGGYNVQPATVTFQLQKGVTLDSGVVVGDINNVVGSTSVITSSMSVVLASAPVNNGFITLTLPSSASNPGLDIMIYKVDNGTGPIIINANGSDLIQSTGSIRLNSIFQHASLHSLGSIGWGSGLGGIQATPPRLFSNPYIFSAGFSVAQASSQVICPLYIPIPVTITGFTYAGGSGSSNISLGIIDQSGNVVVSTGPIPLSGGQKVSYIQAKNLAPGPYYIATLLTNTGASIDGASNNNGGGIPGCGYYTGTTSTISAVTFPPPNATGTAPGISVLVAGGDQSWQ